MSIQLNPIERNELEKAMLGRGVDYETAQLILADFDARVKNLNAACSDHARRVALLESMRPKEPIPLRTIIRP
jgi:hypothetical protein